MARGKTEMPKYQECFLINTWAYWKEGDIHKELGISKDCMNDRINSLRRKLKRHGDERWKLLYRKKEILPEDQLWLIEHYHEGIAVAAKHFGVDCGVIGRKAVTMRAALKKLGDERWRKLYVSNKSKQKKGLANYGNVPRPDRFIKKDENKDPRPDWLVINYTVGV